MESFGKLVGRVALIIVILLGLAGIRLIVDVAGWPGKGNISQEAQEKGGPQTEGEFCTFSTNGRPRYHLEVYAVGHGPDQKLRRDTFVYGARGMQPTEHVIVVSGVTYFWHPGEKQGYKYANEPVSFREYLDLEKFDLYCRSSLIDDSKFLVPKDITWTTPQGLRPG